MNITPIDTSQFLALAETFPVLDVRSPGEYNHAHIPGAYSFPIFSDEERKIIGTTYKQKSRELAVKIGLDFFGATLRQKIEAAEVIIAQHNAARETTHKTVLVHCWRGGMRSAAIAWLLDLYGFKVYTLTGGYKKYRRYVLDSFSIPFSLHILGGYTGSGKTAILKKLASEGAAVVDLEGMASHKGSAFGHIGLPNQPGQEMFENLLATRLREILKNGKNDRGIWLEDESQRIGLVNVPNAFWEQMRQSPVYFIDIPFAERLAQIVQEYGQLPVEKMIAAITRISKKLGHLNAKTAISLLKTGKIAESFEILLKYYDKHYFKSLHNRNDIHTLLKTIQCKSVSIENANQLIRISQLREQETNSP